MFNILLNRLTENISERLKNSIVENLLEFIDNEDHLELVGQWLAVGHIFAPLEPQKKIF